MSNIDFFTDVIISFVNFQQRRAVMKSVIKFIWSFFVVGLTAYFCSKFSRYGVDTFYEGLQKAPLTPPNMVFPIVWPILYALMIVSYYIILKVVELKNLKKSASLFLGQLLLQVVWTWMFFYQAYFAYAGIVIILMIITVYLMIKEFMIHNKYAAYMQYPYLVWLIFAAYMNFGIIYLIW